MAEKPKPTSGEKADQKRSKRDEPVKIDLDPEVALKALLKVEPEAPGQAGAPPGVRATGQRRSPR